MIINTLVRKFGNATRQELRHGALWREQCVDVVAVESLPHQPAACEWCRELSDAVHARSGKRPPVREEDLAKSCATCLHKDMCVWREDLVNDTTIIPTNPSLGSTSTSGELREEVLRLVGSRCTKYLAEDTPDRYMELIMAVGSAFPNETRHETALRYINRAEEVVRGPAMDATPKT